jgi:hypothetical protein
MNLIFNQQTNFHVLKRILLSYVTFILLSVLMNRNNHDRLTSFLFVNLSAMIAIYILSFRLKQYLGFNLMRLLFIGYFIKLLIGYLFWEFYMFPDYFTNPGSNFKFNHLEYLFTEWLMKDIALQRISSGFFYFNPFMLNMKHLPIHYLMSNLYLSGSFNPWDIAVQNTLFSTYTAMMVLAIAKQLGATSRQMKFALIIGIYQPFSLISSIIWRDVVGQFFVSLGGYLTLRSLTTKIHVTLLLLLMASISMIIQREVYFFFPVLAYSAYIIVKSQNKYLLLFLPISLGGLLYLNHLFELSENLNTAYGSNLTLNSLGLFLPINILRIFIGPFPWTQWLKFTDSTIFQIADYFQSVISIALVIIIITSLSRRKFPTTQAYAGGIFLFLLFIPFVFAALGTVDIHQPYMTTGVIFLIPPLVQSSSPKKYLWLSFLIFLFFICVNILWIVSGYSGLGVGSSFR